MAVSSDRRTSAPPAAKPAVDAGPLELSGVEVKQLWSFLDGSIMDVGTRHHLWRSWGLCPRHAWGYALCEIELRGGRPFSTAILHADLIDRAARLVGRRLLPWPRIRARLQARDFCFTCDFEGMVGGRDDYYERDRFEAMAERANRRTRTTALLEQLGDVRAGRGCPLCLEGRGLVCRPHLLHGAEPPPGLSRELERLSRRLEALVGSMTLRRTPVGPPELASWVEALGWLGGWDYANKLAHCRAPPLGPPPPGPGRRDHRRADSRSSA